MGLSLNGMKASSGYVEACQVSGSVTVPASSSSAGPGLFARISERVNSFEDRLWASKDNTLSGRALLSDHVCQGLKGEGCGPEVDRALRPTTDLAPLRRRPRVDAKCQDSSRLEPQGCGSEDGYGSSGSDGGRLKSSSGSLGFTDVSNHIRSFLEHDRWDTCAIELMPSLESLESASASACLIGRSVAVGQNGWQQFRQALAGEAACVRGWVCGHLEKESAMRIRIFAVESPAAVDGVPDKADSQSWLVPPAEDDGFFGLLR